MRKLRVLVLVREGLEPPSSLDGLSEKEIDEFRMEYNIAVTLEELGHDVRTIGVFGDLTPLGEAIREWKPHVVFMLLEEFHGVVTYDQAVVSYLELMRQPYTGCNPRGLLISHDKPLSKKILSYHRIPTPGFAIFPRRRSIRRPKKLNFPILVKSATEDASLGISQASVVNDDEGLVERVKFIHEKIGTDALAEEYIAGRELYVAVLGNRRIDVLPVWELHFGSMPDDVAQIATRKVKWDREYQKKHGITSDLAKDLSPELQKQIVRVAKRVYRALEMSGYARLDMRLREDGRIYVLEANANPDLTWGEDFAEAAHAAGIKFPDLLTKIINLGLRYEAAWQATYG